MVSGLVIKMKLYQQRIRCFINLLKAKLNNNTKTVKILLQFDNDWRSFWHFDCLPGFGYTTPTVDPTLWHMAKLARKHLSNTFLNNEVSMYLIRAFKSNLSSLFIGSNIGQLSVITPSLDMNKVVQICVLLIRTWKKRRRMWMTPSGFILNIKYTDCSWSHDIP